MTNSEPFSLIVLLSGKGSNLQAILNAIRDNKLRARVSLVISDREQAQGLVIAKAACLPCLVIKAADYPDRGCFDQALIREIENYPVDLVVLAGFMRILSANFVNHFSGKLINIHPSLLPAYKGLHTHQRVLDAHEKNHGCSVHFVSAELDGGPVIAQAHYTISNKDNEESLKNKVQQLEHQLYPKVIQWIIDKRVTLLDDNLIIEPAIKMHELPVLS